MDVPYSLLEQGLTNGKPESADNSPKMLDKKCEATGRSDLISRPRTARENRDISTNMLWWSRKRIFGFCLVALALILTHMEFFCITPFAIRQLACKWLGICNLSRRFWQRDPLWDVRDVITAPEDLSLDPQVLHEIPQYILDYAPLVHLYSGEQFWPCDMAEHLFHVTPELNYTPVQGRLQYSNLSNLDRLNEYEHGRHVYLTSNDNVEDRPDWLAGEKNIPDEFDYDYAQGDDDDGRRINAVNLSKKGSSGRGGRSGAPAVLIAVNKGKGIVDAFWFFFYSYNLGNKVFNIRWGNHVGDWEHTVVRFQHGEPKIVFLSEHNFGEAYSYNAVEKIRGRVSILLRLSNVLTNRS